MIIIVSWLADLHIFTLDAVVANISLADAARRSPFARGSQVTTMDAPRLCGAIVAGGFGNPLLTGRQTHANITEAVLGTSNSSGHTDTHLARSEVGPLMDFPDPHVRVNHNNWIADCNVIGHHPYTCQKASAKNNTTESDFTLIRAQCTFHPHAEHKHRGLCVQITTRGINWN